MRVVFLGSPPFALPILEALLASSHRVLALLTPPDRPRGRGRTVQRSPLAALADSRGVPVLQPATTRDPELVAELRALAPDVLVVASYGEILRSEVLDLAPHGSLNVHASLLPRWRGASPIQRAILEGDPVTGVSVQRMVPALDEGDVLHTVETPLERGETAGELLARLAALGGPALVEALDRLESGGAVFTPQDPHQVTYAPKLTKDQGWIDWARPALELERQVHGLNPWPAARTLLPDGRELVVLRARAHPGAPGAQPGELVGGDGLRVAAGEGCLELLEVKPAGKGAMEGSAFLRGARLEAGQVLGTGGEA